MPHEGELERDARDARVALDALEATYSPFDVREAGALCAHLHGRGLGPPPRVHVRRSGCTGWARGASSVALRARRVVAPTMGAEALSCGAVRVGDSSCDV
jgi:hypothetical protein